MLPATYTEIIEGDLYKIQTNIPPKGAVEYNITVDESKSNYIVFRISLMGTKDFSRSPFY